MHWNFRISAKKFPTLLFCFCIESQVDPEKRHGILFTCWNIINFQGAHTHTPTNSCILVWVLTSFKLPATVTLFIVRAAWKEFTVTCEFARLRSAFRNISTTYQKCQYASNENIFFCFFVKLLGKQIIFWVEHRVFLASHKESL